MMSLQRKGILQQPTTTPQPTPLSNRPERPSTTWGLEQPQGVDRGLIPLNVLELVLPLIREGTTIPQTGDATQPRDQGILPPTDQATPPLSGNYANVFEVQTMAKDDDNDKVDDDYDLSPECVLNIGISKFIELTLLAV